MGGTGTAVAGSSAATVETRAVVAAEGLLCRQPGGRGRHARRDWTRSRRTAVVRRLVDQRLREVERAAALVAGDQPLAAAGEPAIEPGGVGSEVESNRLEDVVVDLVPLLEPAQVAFEHGYQERRGNHRQVDHRWTFMV